MIVISDTACISALVRIGELDILQKLFQEVTIPSEVLNELLELKAFGIDTSIFSKLSWLKIQDPTPGKLLTALLNNQRIDPGESYAIALAVEIQADWIILDDLQARKTAHHLHLNVTGLGGILLQAKSEGIIPFVKPLLDLCIQNANFRLSGPVYQKILHLSGE